jgi:hypothetical protein
MCSTQLQKGVKPQCNLKVLPCSVRQASLKYNSNLVATNSANTTYSPGWSERPQPNPGTG